MENDSCSANKNLPTPKMTSESSIQEPSSSKQECNSSISNISVRSLSELKEKESYYEKIEFKKRRNSCENGKKDENENSQKRKSSERRKMEKRSKEHSNESRMSDSRERKKKDRRNRSSEEQMKEEDRSNQSCKANLPDLKLELSNLKQRGEKGSLLVKFSFARRSKNLTLTSIEQFAFCGFSNMIYLAFWALCSHFGF